MPRKVAYTQVTPIPSHIPRQLGIDMLHSHGELIELNPLVLEYHQIKPPRDAPADEYFSTWYEITERIQIIPGTGRFGSGKINFRGVYHDMPWGLQTHVYVPGGVDLRVKYSIRGNQPGEPPEPRELGSQAPAEGLYLREDIEIKCNFTMVSFVKKGMKDASKVMIDRLIKKAELIDAEILRQMMDAHKAQDAQLTAAGQSPQPPNSPGLSAVGTMPYSPNTDQFKRHTMLSSSDVLRKREESLRQALYANGTLQPHPSPGFPHPNMMEMMGSVPGQGQQQQQQQYHNSNPGLAIEMEGDTHFHNRSPLPSPNLNGPRRSTYSELSGDGGYSHASRPQSVGQGGTELSSGWGGSQTSSSSPRVEQGPAPYRHNPSQFAQELPAGK